jgi:hypothetical protein
MRRFFPYDFLSSRSDKFEVSLRKFNVSAQTKWKGSDDKIKIISLQKKEKKIFSRCQLTIYFFYLKSVFT